MSEQWRLRLRGMPNPERTETEIVKQVVQKGVSLRRLDNIFGTLFFATMGKVWANKVERSLVNTGKEGRLLLTNVEFWLHAIGSQK